MTYKRMLDMGINLRHVHNKSSLRERITNLTYTTCQNMRRGVALSEIKTSDPKLQFDINYNTWRLRIKK